MKTLRVHPLPPLFIQAALGPLNKENPVKNFTITSSLVLVVVSGVLCIDNYLRVFLSVDKFRVF